jgi:hypothetical protein
MKILGTALFALLLVGCARTFADLRNDNSAALLKLKIGMTMEEVTAVMGTESVNECALYYFGLFCVLGSGEINPSNTFAVTGTDGKSYVAWMYYTAECVISRPQPPPPTTPPPPRFRDPDYLACHTPVVFQAAVFQWDGRVVGWGTEYWSTIVPH